MKQSIKPTTAVVVIIILVALVALVGWRVMSKRHSSETAPKPGIGTTAGSDIPAGAPAFKGNPNAVPPSGMRGTPSQGGGAGPQAPAGAGTQNAGQPSGG